MLHAAWTSRWPSGGSAPSAAGTCDARMRVAAAGMKPISIGWDMKYAMMPARARPIASRTTPTTSASASPSATYSSLPGVAIELRAPNVSRQVTATGPVCR